MTLRPPRPRDAAVAQAPGMMPTVHDVRLKGIGEVRFGMTVRSYT